MSYILDALNRAEAQRHTPPGLHSRHDVPLHWPTTGVSSWGGWITAAVMMVILMIILMAGGVWLGPPNDATTVSTPGTAHSMTPQTPVVEIPTAPPLPVAVVPSKPKPVSNATARVAAQPVPAIVLLQELPGNVRSEIPKITITGSVYSNTPAHRLLLVNNQVLTPGSLVEPELLLEEIQTSHSVFNYRGIRFRVAH